MSKEKVMMKKSKMKKSSEDLSNGQSNRPLTSGVKFQELSEKESKDAVSDSEIMRKMSTGSVDRKSKLTFKVTVVFKMLKLGNDISFLILEVKLAT